MKRSTAIGLVALALLATVAIFLGGPGADNIGTTFSLGLSAGANRDDPLSSHGTPLSVTNLGGNPTAKLPEVEGTQIPALADESEARLDDESTMAMSTPADLPTPSPGATNIAGPAPPAAAPSQGQVLVAQGYYYQRNGDYDTASERFRTVIYGFPGTLEAADAYLGLAETYSLNRRFQAVITTLQEFLRQFPTDARGDRVLFFLGNAYQALGDWGGATYYYGFYVDRAEVLRGYAYLNAGEGYFQTGDFRKSIEALQKALASDLPRVPRVDALARIGDAYFWLREYAAAIDWYRKALQFAQSAYFKADLTNRVAKAYAAQGDAWGAELAWADVVQNYPATSFALEAVESLPKGSNPPTHFYQGLVYYNNDRYDDAIAAFNEYLVRHPDGEDVPRTHFYLALSYRYNGDPDQAFARFDRVVADHPNDNVAGDALWQSGLLSESLARYGDAIAKYARAASEYPTSRYARDAQFRQGLSQYKLGGLAAARSTWESLASDTSSDPGLEMRAKASFWLGKDLRQAGDSDAARGRFEVAASADDYYGARARISLAGLPAYPGDGLPKAALADDSPVEQKELERWLGSLSGKRDYAYDENNLVFKADPDFRRAAELIRVKSLDEARQEFDGLRAKYASNPIALYELAMFFRRNGIYYPAITTAIEVANLAPARSSASTPRFLQKLIYPVYYREVLTAAAQRDGLDPLLLAAVIRQESLFDQNAQSPATAKGLAQIMPATARGIARDLAMANFDQDDLFKPYISIAFGAWYLKSQFRSFQGNAFQALAAYNAGGGNVGRWLGATPIDDDMFVEDIGFSETQTYVKRVYQQYEAYRELYEK